MNARLGHDMTLCLRCVHYYITWQNAHRYGCKFFGFKSNDIPCEAVYKSSGLACHGFEERPPRDDSGSARGDDDLPPQATFEFRA
jgi:hypothetical protein